MRDLVVKRAVRLHIFDGGARGLRQALQRADLVDHAGDKVGTADVHVAAAKAHQIGVGHMRADDDVALSCRLQCGEDARRVARVKAAGHVGAAHNVQHGGVVAHAPCAKAFAEVAVEVHFHHGGLSLF
ncbi:hypothetical protein SDC9_83702 [bioreactor metagenome]|uniref:Uncharacterized protein n=1 Tax=bioreactor metagenome TaxID=1076179 RepID=A0A644Z897_9ZZZZ